MSSDGEISEIYEQLTVRYNRISTYTIKGLLKGKLKVKDNGTDFSGSRYESPSLKEAEDAFKKYDCAIFTAFRGGYSLEENLERNARLKADITAAGLKFRPVKGCYREADWEYANIEYCFFLYNRDNSRSQDFFSNAFTLSEKYEQDSFLYKRAGINRSAFLVATNDGGRRDLHGDIKFAGQLYTNVPNVEAWTDCSDGRFAFQLKGMIIIDTENKNIKFGEGDLFDIKSYNPDGLIAIFRTTDADIYKASKEYSGEIPLVQHVFNRENQSEALVHNSLVNCLKEMKENNCRKIAIHCSSLISDSPVPGARIAYKTIQEWAKKNTSRFDWIVIIDTYGDYIKVFNQQSHNP